MNDEKEAQHAGQDAGEPKILAEPKAWWRFDPETRKTFNAISGAVGSISGIITITALFVHGNMAILLWSAGVDVAALAALLLVRLAGGRTLKINFEVKLQRVLSAVSVVVIALACWGIYAYLSHPRQHVSAGPTVSPRTVSPSASVSPSPSATPSVTPTQVLTPTPVPISAGPGIRRNDVLVLDDQGTAYDLDAAPPGWNTSFGVPWTFQNIEYYPGQGLAISDEPISDVLMGGRGNWTYQDCAQADYGGPDDQKNPNNISMSDLKPGQGICVHTQNDAVNNPGKTDGGHYVLLVVQQVTPTALTLRVKVWQ
jgi:hypothetical protein